MAHLSVPTSLQPRRKQRLAAHPIPWCGRISTHIFTTLVDTEIMGPRKMVRICARATRWPRASALQRMRRIPEPQYAHGSKLIGEFVTRYTRYHNAVALEVTAWADIPATVREAIIMADTERLTLAGDRSVDRALAARQTMAATWMMPIGMGRATLPTISPA